MFKASQVVKRKLRVNKTGVGSVGFSDDISNCVLLHEEHSIISHGVLKLFNFTISIDLCQKLMRKCLLVLKQENG